MLSPPHPALSDVAIDWLPFLSRPRLPSPSAATLEQFHEASILVTGAGGSIGSALSLRLSALYPRRLILFEASEQALYRLQSKLAKFSVQSHATTVLGSVTDAALIQEILATHQPTLVFHAAAYKHVALLEEHPLAAVLNNALGTHSLVMAAQNQGVKRLILLSTDKAVEPTSILGATKRIAEQITLAQGGLVLRLCNVLGTEGSVIDTFLQQIHATEPLTIADADADRYFITLDEAVDLLLSAVIIPPSSTLLVPRLERPHRITALADYLIGAHPTQVPLRTHHTGLRAGDKLHEKLWADTETATSTSTPGCLQIKQTPLDSNQFAAYLTSLQTASKDRNLSAALEAILKLVPDYLPSQNVLALAQQTGSGVPHP